MPARIAILAITASVLFACGGDDSTSPSTDAGGSGASSGGGSTGGGSTGSTGGSAGAGGSAPAPDYCTACASPTVVGSLRSGALGEVSGLAASAAHAGVLYANNDSGDSARFFALASDGADLGTFDVDGASAIDWEDMARGPCGARSCLFLADIGDNLERRSTYALYRVPEPTAVGGDGPATADALPFEYPDGSHNAETLLVDPSSGVIAIVTKVSVGPSSVYEFSLPLTPGTQATLAKSAELQPPEGENLFTGGAVHPAGHGILLRTYDRLWFYAKGETRTIAEALATTPCSVPVAEERQGETVTWTADGTGYVTISEGSGAAINVSICGR